MQKMYKVIIDAKAERDLNDIFLYITETLKAPEAAGRLYSRIKKEISGLSTMPHRCSPVTEEPYSQIGVRKLLIGNYIAFFFIDENAQEIHVFRILYNRREWHGLL